MSGNDTEAAGGAAAAGAAGGCDADAGVEAGDRLFRFVVHGVLLNAIGCGGLLGNALSVLVLSRPQMRSSINCLLVGLAACDTVLILTSVLLFGLTAVFPYTGRLRHYYYHVSPHLTPYAYPLANAAQTMSVYLTLVVTVERWVAVCHPFRAKALCTSARARWYVLGTALFALAYNAPKFLEARVVARMEGGELVYCVAADEAFRTPAYVLVYIHSLYMVVMYLVPFSALAALNACIVRQVRRAQAERARLSRGQRRELSLATMLLVVVLVFFLCNLLPLVTNAFEVFLGDRLERLDPLVKTSNLLVTLNSSVNFVIYVIFGEKFKRVFLKMFCGGAPARRATGARDSPDHTRDDSFASCGERVSLRHAASCGERVSLRHAASCGERVSLRHAASCGERVSLRHAASRRSRAGSSRARALPAAAAPRVTELTSAGGGAGSLRGYGHGPRDPALAVS